MKGFFPARERARTTRTRLPVQATGPDTRRTTSSCESYAPGHQMHYIHQGQALRSPSEHATTVSVEDDRVMAELGDGERLVWRHHDPERLQSILDLFPNARVAYPQFHALRVGPYWFNCAPDDFAPCEFPVLSAEGAATP